MAGPYVRNKDIGINKKKISALIDTYYRHYQLLDKIRTNAQICSCPNVSEIKIQENTKHLNKVHYLIYATSVRKQIC